MVRIVKMIFQEKHIADFKKIYANVNTKIILMPGCKSVQLLQDIQNPSIFFTYSHWNSETELNQYRDSLLFKETWQTIKPWFAEKANVWSVEQV
jgi:heme oxygenase (mycobilin-producing)